LPMVSADTPAPSFLKADKAVRPSQAELLRNPRARSATLRSATRSDASPWVLKELAA
jgi:16S rRNA (cytosine1402-N4)-methyltransferase